MRMLAEVWEFLISHKDVIVMILLSINGYKYVTGILVRPIMIGVFVRYLKINFEDAVNASVKITSFEKDSK